jgi:plastocyanin
VALVLFGVLALCAHAQFRFSTFAGTPGVTGSEDGAGASARFRNPTGIAIDSSGNIFVADTANQVIRKISPGGTVSTFAGTVGIVGSSDGTGTAAKFNYPWGLAVDSAGNLYVGDSNNHIIRKITPAGIVTTIAGLAGVAGSTDGAGAAARFSHPSGVAVDSQGNIFVSDYSNTTIRKITPSGVVSTFAGAPGVYGQADGVGAAARFHYPDGIAIDIFDQLYVVDTGNHTIRKITPAGSVSTFAGVPQMAGNRDSVDGPALFNSPVGIGIEPSGALLITDRGNHAIRRVTLGGFVTTIAGTSGTSGFQDGPGISAQFKVPIGIAAEANGNIYVVDTSNQVIRIGRSIFGQGIFDRPTSFNAESIFQRYPTLRQSLNNDPDMLWDYFLQAGVYQGITDGSFSASTYLSNNPSFATVFGTDWAAAAIQWYVWNGALSPHGNAISYDSTTFPVSVAPGATVTFTATVSNIGTKTWSTTHALALRDENFANLSFAALATTAPGASKTVSFTFTAPTNPGSYVYRLQGVQNGVEWFRTDRTLTLQVGGTGTPNTIRYNTTTFPAHVTPGSTVSFTYNVSNVGSNTWGSNHYLVLRNGDFEIMTMAPLATVVPGGNKTVTYTFTAPTAAGTYTYRIQGLENGVAWFRTDMAMTLQVGTPTNVMSYGNSSFPLNVAPGATVSFSQHVTNTGTKTWGSNHYLVLRDQNFANIAFQPLSTTAAGGTKTVNYTFTAPTTPGTYTYRVQGLENGVEWFRTDQTLTLRVGEETTNAITYNSSTLPTTLNPGQTVNFTYNVTNTGTRTWGNNHYLVLRAPDYSIVSMSSLATTVAGGGRTVSYTFTAPTTPGTYSYRVQGLENGVEWFRTDAILTVKVVAP